MDLLLLWQFELIYLITYKILYLKGLKDLSLKLAILCDLNVLSVQPNFVAKSVIPKLYRLIMGSFLKLLSMVDVFFIYNHQFSKLC